MMTKLSVLIVILIAAWMSSQPGFARKNSRFYWKKARYVMPWTKGPNVCAVEEVIGSRKRYYSECMTFIPRRICEKPTFVRYHCCTGYERADDTKGCQGVVPMTDLMGVIKHLYLRDFRKLAKSSNVADLLINDGAFTVFAPHNKAFNNLPQDVRSKLGYKNLNKNLMLYHIVNGRLRTYDLTNELALPTLYRPDNDTLIINRYSTGIVTVNCARLILPNQPATNGIIHVIEKVVQPVPNKNTVMEILLNDHRFGEMVTALILTGLGQELRNPGPFTIFAPTDEAFVNAPQNVIDRVMGDNQMLIKLLRYHMIDRRICSAAILGPTSLPTLEGQKVNLTCDVMDRFTVNGNRILEGDLIGTNGVVHAVDTLLIPNAAKSLSEVLAELELQEFLEYAQASGLSDILEMKVGGNYTVFAPSEEAFAKLTPEQRNLLQSQPQAAERVFKYHVTQGKILTDQLVGSARLQSINVNESGSNLRVSAYTKDFGINGAIISSRDHEAGNGVIHVVDKVIFPPEGATMDKIKEDPRLSTFMSMTQLAGLDELFLEAERSCTVFAPTNDAFDGMKTDTLERLMRDPGDLKEFLQYHIIHSTVYGGGIRPKLSYRFKTLSDHWLSLKRDKDADIIKINEVAEVLTENVESINGVLHVVDTVLNCPCLEKLANEI